MILSCNSCEKKFVVPDNAIGTNGRLVQCSSCGNKWTQFPIDNKTKTKKEISKMKYYDYFVVSDEVKNAVNTIEALILAEKQRVSRLSKR